MTETLATPSGRLVESQLSSLLVKDTSNAIFDLGKDRAYLFKVGYSSNNAYKLLFDPQIYKEAYERIKSKPGNMTPGVDRNTLDGFSNEKIYKIIEAMKSRGFKFQPSRRVMIPKKNGKHRAISIPSPLDKVVQSAIHIILEKIYEPLFRDSSHGFRPNKSCHSALNTIKT